MFGGVSSVFFTYQDTNYPLSILAADKTDLLTFFQSEDELTDIFILLLSALAYLVDDSDVFVKTDFITGKFD